MFYCFLEFYLETFPPLGMLSESQPSDAQNAPAKVHGVPTVNYVTLLFKHNQDWEMLTHFSENCHFSSNR
jgi:hypothetical protein